MQRTKRVLSVLTLTLAAFGADAALGQHARPILRDRAPHAWSGNVILPQSRAFRTSETAPELRVERVRADILIVDGLATTTLDVTVSNNTERDAEAELLLPVPDNAAVRHFDFMGSATQPTATLLLREEARATYDSIVAKLQDPALLEFAGASLLRSSVFPVTRGSQQTVRVRYEHLVPSEGGRWDYELPRSESLATGAPWEVTLEVHSTRPIADVYSPTHDLPRVEGDAKRVKLRARADHPMQPGPLRVSVLLAEGPLTTTLFTSADTNGQGGWFLLLAGLGEVPAHVTLPPREVTLVIDRSGSMAGEKFDQAKAAARQVLEGLAFGEAIQILDYSNSVERFAPTAVIKSKENLPALRAYLDGLTVGGGTNLDAALGAALATPPTPDRLPVVLFLTDGLPTQGETREVAIRDRIEKDNAHQRRVFTFGVGNDVNAPLLDALAVESRGRASYVRPDEDVERAVADVFEDLSGPVVTDLEVRVENPDGSANTRLVRDLYPQVLPDLFRGDRLVLVGRYLGATPARFHLSGKRGAAPSQWTLDYDFAKALPRNGFVQRLWAMRRIAALEDTLRRTGADSSALASLSADPKFAEIVKEMLELATNFGVLTDSTAFLALEGTQLGDPRTLFAATSQRGIDNANCRTGLDGVALQQNVAINRAQGWANYSNTFFAPTGELVACTTVQTLQGRTFFRRGERWIEGALVLDAKDLQPTRTIQFGSPEHATLVEELRADGRAAQLSLGGEVLLRHKGEAILVVSGC